MIPRVQNEGKSFKGAALYYLHDKRRPSESERLTSERVAWTAARNLPTDDPELAWRIMAATAMAQNDIKRAAGLRPSKRCTNPIQTWSLSWHPEQNPSKEEMLAAADETIKLLGFADRQALIVCHNDTAHPHVHIIANRVSHENGLTAKLGFTKSKSSRFALKYEREGGKIYCQGRLVNHERRLKGEFVRAVQNLPRAVYEAMKAAKARAPELSAAVRFNPQARYDADLIRAAQKKIDAQLMAGGKALYRRQNEALWRLVGEYRQAKDKITFAMRAEAEHVRQAAWKEKLQARRDLYREHWQEKRRFERADRTFIGRLQNALWAASRAPKISDRDLARRTGVFLLAAASRKKRLGALEAAQKAERTALTRSWVKSRVRQARDGFQPRYSEAYRAYRDQRAELLQKHELEKKALQRRWRTRKEEKARAWQTFFAASGRLNEAARRHRLEWARDRAEEAYEREFKALGPEGPVTEKEISRLWKLAREADYRRALANGQKPPARSKAKPANDPGGPSPAAKKQQERGQRQAAAARTAFNDKAANLSHEEKERILTEAFRKAQEEKRARAAENEQAQKRARRRGRSRRRSRRR